MNVTLDTNFLVSATQWNNSVCAKVLERLLKQNTNIFTTKEILEELREVLERDFKHSKAYCEEITDFLRKRVQIVEPETKLEVIKNDPDDNKILECAIASNSGFILTYDNHILDLKRYEGIQILAPGEFLKKIK